MSYTATSTDTFTITHARHLASKVSTDLLRFRRFYGKPSLLEIDEYEEELIELLKSGYVYRVTYGLQRNREWVTAVRYKANEAGILCADDDPGGIWPVQNTANTLFSSYLEYSAAWSQLTDRERVEVAARLPVRRVSAEEPGVECGYWASERSYSAGGRTLERSGIRKW